MTTDFHQLQRAARALKLTYQQLLSRYHADRGQDAPRSGAIAWAQREVERAQDPARARRELRASIDSRYFTVRSWTPLNCRLDPDVHVALIARADLDREKTPRISPSHYLDAALRAGPRQLDDQLACMREFITTRGTPLSRGRATVYSVSTDAHTTIQALHTALDAARRPREETWAVVSALVARFLGRLTPQPPR